MKKHRKDYILWGNRGAKEKGKTDPVSALNGNGAPLVGMPKKKKLSKMRVQRGTCSGREVY